MDNVYEKVRSFYEQDDENEFVVSREWVEGFLRQEAWQGKSETTLNELWEQIKFFILYIDENQLDLEEFFTEESCYELVTWLQLEPTFTVSLPSVRQLFAVLTEFFTYLASRRLIGDWQVVATAAKEIAGGKRLNLRPKNLLRHQITTGSDLSESKGNLPVEELAFQVTSAVEGLMNKLGNYFQQTMFMNDFERALFLYTGPFESVPEEEYHEFWLGFWDYFLFDYHLIASDKAPLRFFYEANEATFSVEEKQLLHELLKARYTAFYIEKFLDQNFVECVNLFTGEKFRLPQPDFDYKKMKHLLFFGHVFSGEMTLINYVTSIEVSLNLRRRIKEEVITQKKIFEIKQPEASWEEFLARHALNIKYTVDILLSLSKVNVTPFQLLQRDYLQGGQELKADEVNQHILVMMPSLGFSRYDIQLVQKLWADYSFVTKAKVRDSELWAASLVYIYSKMNGHNPIKAVELAKKIGKNSTSIYACGNKLKKTLTLTEFDPRYLSEEGFIFLLLKN